MLTNILNILTGMLLLFFVPGYALIYALFPKKGLDIYERISIAILSSISISILPVFALNYLFKTPINYYTVVLSSLLVTCACAIIYLARTREIPEFFFEMHEYGTQKILRVLCVLLILAASFLLVYSIHQYYPYPYLLDEWQHIAQGIQVADTGNITLNNPYYKDGNVTNEPGYYEKGFHVFLAECFMLTGQEPARFYTILPALFAAITGLIVFTFTYKTTKNYATGLFALLFYAALRSNISVLGPWFYVPLSMGFAYIYAILYLAAIGLERYSIRLLTLSSILLLTLALIHPWSAAIAYTVVILYVIMRRRILADKNVILIAGVLAIPLVSFGYVINTMWQGDFYKTAVHFAGNYLISGLGIPVKEVANPMYFVSFYGIAPLALALFGAYCLFRKKDGPERVFLTWTTFIFAEMALFQITGKTILAPYERIIYYAFLSLVPLSAIGLYGLLEYLFRKTRNKEIRFTASLICIGAVAYLLFTPYYDNRANLYKIIDDDTYYGIKALEKTGRHHVILARPEISSAIYPVTRNYVVSINPAQLGWDKRGLEDNRRFFMTDCPGKLQVIKKYDVDYVFVRKEDAQDCPGLKLIYREKGSYIYEVVNSGNA
jgi:hypothetical protein